MSEAQFITFALAVLASWLGLRSATMPQVIEAASGWADAIQAFIYVTLGWAVLCVARAPFALVAEDRLRGRWDKNHFIYREPILVAVERFEAGTGETQRRRLSFDDAAPYAFVYFRIEMTPNPESLVVAYLSGGYPRHDVELIEPGLINWGRFVGIRLPADKQATLFMRMKLNTVPVVCRVYCDRFFVGKDDASYAK